MRDLREALARRVLVLDGAMGTMLQAASLTAEDFGGAALEGCNEHLNLTRPDVVRGIHRAYREAGADCVYPIFCHDEEGIAAYVQAAAVVNVHVHPSAPGLARLAELGVARASFGGSLFRAAMEAASSYAA